MLNKKSFFCHKTLFLYIIKELLLYFFVCFLFFFFIFFVNQILLMAEEILSKKAPLKDVLLLMFYSLPLIIAISAPYAILVGTLMGLGRFVSDLEFLSMKALGVSSSFILLPVLASGLVISIISFITNDILLPSGTIKFNEVYYNLATSTPALELESYSVKRNDNSIVIAGLIKDRIVHNLLIIDKTASDSVKVLGAATTEVEKSSTAAIIMKMSILNPRLLTLNLNDKANFDAAYGNKITYNVLAKDVKSDFISSTGPDRMTSRDLYNDLKEKIKEGADSRTINIYKMEFHKKFSLPFGALFFAIMAYAISSAGKLHNQSVGFIIGLLICVAHWAVSMGGQLLVLNSNMNGIFLIWLPNIMLFCASLLFFGSKLLK